MSAWARFGRMTALISQRPRPEICPLLRCRRSWLRTMRTATLLIMMHTSQFVASGSMTRLCNIRWLVLISPTGIRRTAIRSARTWAPSCLTSAPIIRLKTKKNTVLQTVFFFCVIFFLSKECTPAAR